MNYNKQNRDQRLIVAAEIALDDFRQGEREVSDYTFKPAYEKGELLANFKSEMNAFPKNDRDGKLEFLQSIIDTSAAPERTQRIMQGKEFPTADELSTWGENLSDSGEIYMTDYVFVPLFRKSENIGWVIIQESGPPLEREYEITGIFATEDEMNKFFDENYE